MITEVLMVVGGTEKYMSHRALEFSEELEPAPEDIVEKVKEDLAKANTKKEFRNVLTWCADNDYNFVGSRDYVYLSKCLLKTLDLIDKWAIDDSFNPSNHDDLFTRNLGLREAFVRVYK